MTQHMILRNVPLVAATAMSTLKPKQLISNSSTFPFRCKRHW